ncbi:MAG: hypothetical protein AAGA30_21125, partial [Planctomycetota bacterium]
MTESILRRSVSSFGIRDGQRLTCETLSQLIGVPILIDINLDGLFDENENFELNPNTSLKSALSQSLKRLDTCYQVLADGTIRCLSIDDEFETWYMSNLIYDVSGVAGTADGIRELHQILVNTVLPDSWEYNGTGNGT